MKTERKMLISIALIFIMLLNCIMPIFSVYATTGDAIVLNSKLYEALKTELTEQAVVFEADDDTRTIKISSEVIATITRLDLNNYGISDLTGLEKFVGLNHLELSGNNLTKDSNLAAIASLPLNYLDLSTNKIEDISDISGLVSAIRADNGSILLSNQTVTTTKIVQKVSEGTLPVELPKILTEAGFIKAVWQTVSSTGPSVKTVYRTNDALSSADIDISSEGLLTYTIYIHDDETEAGSASNLNRADINPLKESKFILYVVVHGEDETGIHIPDSNLYKEIKKQLTSGMDYYGDVKTSGNTENKDLASYPYKVDYDGNIVYDECTYSVVDGVTVLYVEGVEKYVLDALNGKVYLYDASVANKKGDFYTKTYERAVVETEDPANGVITSKWGYKVAVNGDNETLYKRAYDAPKVFVIDDQVLMNKITSLQLNNKQIRDLTGIEWFVGLKSSLDVSQNYLSNIDPIYNLQGNKDVYEAKLQEKYNNVLNTRAVREGGNLSTNLSATIAAKNSAEATKTTIINLMNTVVAKMVEVAKVSKTKTNDDGTVVEDPDYSKNMDTKIKEINTILQTLVDHTVTNADGSTSDQKGLTTILDEYLNSSASSLQNVYSNLKDLYDVYNNQYKLLTLLTDEMNYMDFEEYVTYKDKVKTTAGTRELVSAQVSLLTSLEAQNRFTYFEKMLIESAFPTVNFEDTTGESTLAKYFSDYMEATGDVNLEWLNTFREIALYSEMANYCLVERMCNGETACSCEDYLKARIKEFKDDSIDVSLEESLLADIEKVEPYIELYEDIVSEDPIDVDRVDDFTDRFNAERFNTSLVSSFMTYNVEKLGYGGRVELSKCKGAYKQVTDLSYFDTKYTLNDILNKQAIQEVVEATNEEGDLVYPDAASNVSYAFSELKYGGIINTIDFEEWIGTTLDSDANNLYLFEEAVTISSRFVNSNVSRYVYLPKLKNLDISYNADLTGLERLGELTYLRSLNAASCYISNIEATNWNAITYLRKLDLSNNFITSIKPLENLAYIEDLNVSKNLISGAFDFNFTASKDSLKNLDLSYNQIDDITRILYYLDTKTGGNYANYLAREDTLNINLANQELEIIIDEAKFLPENPTTVNVDLPIIFTQLLAIDTERTTFGLKSIDGRIESEGRYVTLNTRTTGDKTGTVSVLADNGHDSCVGLGTTATIKYKVEDRTVSSVTVTPNALEMGVGESQAFVATVTGDNLLDTSVTWVVDGTTNPNTTIDQNGLLTIAADETATSVDVIAVSNFDGTKMGTAEVTIVTRDIKTFVIDPTTATIIKGEDATFTVTVDGDYLRPEDKEVVWEVIPDVATTSADTKAETNGNVLTLKVGADETATSVVVKATSKRDNTKVAEATVTLVSREVTSITINPIAERKEVGSQVQFTAVVDGNYLRDQDKGIIWSVEGTTNPNTTIDQNGLLTIAADETATSLTVKATSDFDNNQVATATVTVYKRTVTGVTIASADNISRLEAGNSLQFTATIDGTDLEDSDKGIVWSVSGNKSTDTKVDSNGLLTVSADEKSTEITVTATSAFDNTKLASKAIAVYSRKVTGVTITPNSNVVVTKGEEQAFQATVEGENLEDTDKTVTWSIVTPNVATGTSIDATGKLTVASTEENTELVIKAVSKFDNTKEATVTVTLKTFQPAIGLGYNVDNETMLGVETKMPVDAFKEKVAKDYKVVVKTDGENKEEVTDGIIKTGMWVYIYDKNDTELTTPLKDENGDLLVYQIVVKGDVNGDGVADGLDTNKIKAHINEVETLSGAQYKAADINSDGDIDIRDTKLLLYHIAEVKGYTFDYVATEE